MGLEATDNAVIINKQGFQSLNPKYLRSNFGSAIDPYDTLYQHYLEGGWGRVDLEILPDLAVWREIGAEPLVIFMYGGQCKAPTYEELDSYAVFISEAVNRYGLNYIEVWNEPDALGGLASLYGCFGDINKLIFLINKVQSKTDTQVGSSFMLDNEKAMQDLERVSKYVDWVGIHHYGMWFKKIIEPYPGSLEAKLERVIAFNKPVWLTELNLRSPRDECGQDYEINALKYVQEAIDLLKTKDVHMFSILVYSKPPDWQCTGFKNTPLDEYLRLYE